MPIVFSVLGDDRPGIVDELSTAILEHQCNIEDSRMSVMGGVFAVILLVSGEADALKRVQDTLENMQNKGGLTISSRTAGERSSQGSYLPYQVQIVSMDHPGIVNRLSHFFATRGINIQQLETSSYSAAHTATPMFAVHMTIEIHSSQHLAELRDSFYTLCDEYNLDGVIEPKGPK
jgi:glycine cleavage system transcriptional repressor